MFKRFIAALEVTLLLTVPVRAQQTVGATLSITVTSEGLYSARLDAVLPVSGSSLPSLYTALLPMSLATSSPASSSDVLVAVLAAGIGHTLLVIAPPLQRAAVSVDLPGPFGLQKTPDGKAKLEWEFSDRLLSDVEKRLVASAIPINAIEVTLPKRYDPADISTYPSSVQRVDERTLRLPVQGQVNAFIAFPNPAQETSQQAKALISFLVGILALTVQIQPLRRRRVLVFVLILFVSAAVLGITAYFGPRLPTGSEFIPFAAASIPSALWSFIASAYLLLAKRYQATITGRVTINNIPAISLTVTLFDVVPNREQEGVLKAKRQVLDEYGRYQFFIWVFRSYRTFVVTARYFEQTERRTGITVSPQARISEVPAINFIVEERPPNIALEPAAQRN